MLTRRPVRLLIVNLHATSVPGLIVPWLWLLLAARRIDAVTLQECTDRHARWLTRRRGWLLIRAQGYGEAIYVRRRQAGPAHVAGPITRGWRGRHTGRMHPGRMVPRCLVAGWLTVWSVHLPPGWVGGPMDRVEAGRDWLQRAGGTADHYLTPDQARALLGDWNAQPTRVELRRWRTRHGLTATGDGIDHVATAGCTVTRCRRLRPGPGMDHRPVLVVVEP